MAMADKGFLGARSKAKSMSLMPKPPISFFVAAPGPIAHDEAGGTAAEGKSEKISCTAGSGVGGAVLSPPIPTQGSSRRGRH